MSYTHDPALDLLERLIATVEKGNRSLRRIEQILHWSTEYPFGAPVSISLNLKWSRPMATGIVGQKAIATATETDAAGQTLNIVAADLVYTTSDPTIVTITANPDGTATVDAIAPGTATLTVTDTAHNLTGTAGVTVTAATDNPTTLTLEIAPFTTSTTGSGIASAVKSEAKTAKPLE